MSTNSTPRIANALQSFMGRSSVARSLDTIKRYAIGPERIDEAILAAINASLCLVSGGDHRVADGFNDDIARNGRNFGRHGRVIGCA